jgi:lipopolysaccharide export system protein LptA
MTIRRIALLPLVAMPLLAAPPARSQPIDLSSGGPVEVTARDGFEWHDNDQTVIASGDARAVRGTVTVLADHLVAHYRKKAAAPGGPTNASATAGAGSGAAAGVGAGNADTGSNEIYRLDAIGHVRIVTPTDEAVGDKAVYDIDQSVLVMTGHGLRLTTPTYVLTARDSLEYWSQRHLAVGRGNALVVATDGRRLSADVLVGYTTDATAQPSQATQPQTAQPQPAQAPSAAGSPASPAAPKPDTPRPGAGNDGAGKLQRVEAFGNVEVRTQTDTVRGDRGVYVPDTGVARVLGHVQVIHNQNVITGAAADVHMKTGLAHVVADPDRRVQGLIMPNDAQTQAGGKPAPGKPAR